MKMGKPVAPVTQSGIAELNLTPAAGALNPTLQAFPCSDLPGNRTSLLLKETQSDGLWAGSGYSTTQVGKEDAFDVKSSQWGSLLPKGQRE